MWTRKPWVIGAVVVFLLYLAGYFLATIVIGLGCSGDGGEPYAAPASPYGRFCATADSDVIAFAWWVVPSAIVAGLFYAALARRSRRTFVAAVVAAVALPALTFAIVWSLPTKCPGDDETRRGCNHHAAAAAGPLA